MKQEYIIPFESGKVSPSLLTKIEKDFNGVKDCRLRITAEKYRAKRSDAQNKYWWSCITILANELGYTKDEMHEIAKCKLCKKSMVHQETGEVLEYLASTTSFNKMEFAEITEQLGIWAAQSFNVILPFPGEQLKIE